jgi:LysM repeat protein
MAIALSVAPVSRPLPRARVSGQSHRSATAHAVATTKKQSLRLTRRGRLVVFFAVVVAMLAALMMFGSMANATSTNAGPATAVVVVQPGESLWSIAQTIAPDQDPRATINDIKDLNGMNTAVVAVGQSIVVPVIR